MSKYLDVTKVAKININETDSLMAIDKNNEVKRTSLEVEQVLNDSTNPVASNAVKQVVDTKQDTLISGTNIKTINGQDITGAGDIEVATGEKVVEFIVPYYSYMPYTSRTPEDAFVIRGKLTPEQIAANMENGRLAGQYNDADIPYKVVIKSDKGGRYVGFELRVTYYPEKSYPDGRFYPEEVRVTRNWYGTTPVTGAFERAGYVNSVSFSLISSDLGYDPDRTSASVSQVVCTINGQSLIYNSRTNKDLIIDSAFVGTYSKEEIDNMIGAANARMEVI